MRNLRGDGRSIVETRYKVKAKNGWDSDYRVAKELDLSRSTVSVYRSKLDSTMDEDTAIKVAGALGTKPEVILVDQVFERSKNNEARAALSKVLKRLGGAGATALTAVFAVLFATSFVADDAHAARATADLPAETSQQAVYTSWNVIRVIRDALFAPAEVVLRALGLHDAALPQTAPPAFALA